ncbi:MAG: orotidine-5'-phosphate decarboxylase [Candidatus Stahlbacteria bacterium]|nr:orotidine-5'-phosphate decarboxylase [Candidatus Stahlbacteria bacterium]
MNFYTKWRNCVERNHSLVCVGLDTDIKLISKSLLSEPNPIFAFNRELIEATKDYASAFKLNAAFYEAEGLKGIEDLKQTREYIPAHIPVILDAKRGDIGNTSKLYARMAFEEFGFDALTVSPYLGSDSVAPFLEYGDKYIFILCLTSNPGAIDLQMYGEPPLYLRVAQFVNKWNKKGNCGLVVGATKPEQLAEIRKIVPKPIFLIPGIGAQGGKIEEVIKYGGDNLIINASRSIIYASSGIDFAQKAQSATIALRDEINRARTVGKTS